MESTLSGKIEEFYVFDRLLTTDNIDLLLNPSTENVKITKILQEISIDNIVGTTDSNLKYYNIFYSSLNDITSTTSNINMIGTEIDFTIPKIILKYEPIISSVEIVPRYGTDILHNIIENSTDKYVSFKYSSNNDNGSNEIEYTINFIEETECDILLLDDTNYKYLTSQLLNGLYVIKVGIVKSCITNNNNYYQDTINSYAISSGYTTDITGTTQTYNSKEIIIRYKTEKLITDPKLSSLSSLTPELNSLLYFNTSNSINYLELDPTTLEITTDNKLKVIGGGGGGTQVLIQNESDTITSNLEKPIIDSSNLVTDGLIAYYKFDGDLTDETDITGQLTEPNGNITYNTITQSAIFTSTISTNYALTPDINKNVPLSFSFWFRTLTSSDQTMMAYGDYNSKSPSIQFDVNGSRLKIFTALDVPWTISPESSVSINTWYHCVYTLDNSNSVNTKLYLNGVLKQSSTGTASKTLGTYKNLVIGESGDAGRGFNGNIDDLRIYDRVLSVAEVEKLYNAQYITKSLITDSTDEVVSFKYNPNNNNGSGQTEYTINFPQDTECEILLLDDINYKHLEIPLETLNRTYTVKVGISESSISKSGYIKTTSGEVRTPELLSISGYASWDNHKAHAETNNGRLPYRDELIEFLDPDRSEPENYTYSQYLNNTSTASSEPYDVWVPVNDYVGAFVEIGKHASHKYYTLKTPNGTETYLTKDLGTDTPFYTITAGTSTSSSSIWGNNSSWVPNTNIFYVPYYSTDIKGTTQIYSSKEVIIRYKTQIVTTVTRIDPKLSSLSSLTPELNSLLYFNTSNSINYLELDPTTLEITSDNKLKVIDGTSSGVDGIDGTSTTILEISKHIIPDTNATYDIGSAEKKIRHLFLSDNSLWIGDDNKFSISEGKNENKEKKKKYYTIKIIRIRTNNK